MTIVVDPSSPPRIAASAVASTTAAFNPPAGVLICATASDANRTFTITNNGTALAWTLIAIRAGGTATTTAAAHFAVLPAARTGMTITATKSGTAAWHSVKAYVLTGADTTDPVGGSTTGTSTTNNLTTTAFVVEQDDSLGFAVGDNFTTDGMPTSADMTASASGVAGSIESIDGYKPLGPAGSNATFNLDAAGTSGAQWNWVSFEVKAAALVAAFTGLFLPF